MPFQTTICCGFWCYRMQWQSLAAFSLCAEISFEHELRFLWFCLQAIAIVVKWSSVLMSSRAIKLLQPESMVKTIRQHVNGVPWRCLKKLIDSRGIIEFLSPINDLHPPTVFHHSNVLVSFHVSRSLRLVLPIHVLSPKRKKKLISVIQYDVYLDALSKCEAHKRGTRSK